MAGSGQGQAMTPQQAGGPPGPQVNVPRPTAGQPGGSVYDQSAGAYSGALGGTRSAMSGPNIGQFMNPYTSMVTGRTLSNLERQRQMATNTTGAQASAAGAFGGSRHGVADALTNEAFARQGADTFANLQNQGFNTALGAAQNQQGIEMQGAGQLGNLSNMGFGFGQQIGATQGQQGALQQGVMQSLIDSARAQYGSFTGAPENSLTLPLTAVGSANMGQGTQTTTQSPGLFNILGGILGTG